MSILEKDLVFTSKKTNPNAIVGTVMEYTGQYTK